MQFDCIDCIVGDIDPRLQLVDAVEVWNIRGRA